MFSADLFVMQFSEGRLVCDMVAWYCGFSDTFSVHFLQGSYYNLPVRTVIEWV